MGTFKRGMIDKLQCVSACQQHVATFSRIDSQALLGLSPFSFASITPLEHSKFTQKSSW